MTYGQIAALAGSRRGARQVVRILHSQSKTLRLPWHRVVNSKGEIAIKDEGANFAQKLLLEAEKVLLDERGNVELSKYQFLPSVDYLKMQQ